MRRTYWLSLLGAALALVLALVAAGCGGNSKKTGGGGNTTTSSGNPITAALVSDVGHFNDKSFNESQLNGLNKAKTDLNITAIPLQSNSASDYLPNCRT